MKISARKNLLSKLALHVSLTLFLIFSFANQSVAEEELVEVANQSFDAQSLNNNSFSFLYVEDWEQEGNGGADTFNVGYGLVPQPTLGENVARLFTVKVDGEDPSRVESSPIVHYLYQPLAENAANNTEYTLTFDVGNPAGGQDDGVVITAYLVTGTEISSEQNGQFIWSQPLTTIPDGGFLIDRTTTLRITKSPHTSNMPLQIVFAYENTSTGDGECMVLFTDYLNKQYCYQSIAYIDNIRLTARPIEPAANGRKF